MATVFYPDILDCLPSVFAVDDEYQILVPFKKPAVVWAKIGENTYYDDLNGILRSNCHVHRIHVPMTVLDAAKEYTLIFRVMTDRKPYFPESEEERQITVSFRPVQNEKINIYLLSDAHNLEKEPIAAGRYFGEKIDLLILNGDIPNHSGDVQNFNSVYRIAAGITNGECPVVFSRGNHDTRGIRAEEFGMYTPTSNGKTYYTFRLGTLWGMVLDCGEDKPDSNPEYGHTICFHHFRLQETQFIKNVIKNADSEYNAPGIKNRIVISHIPFTYVHRPPFDIEQELYAQWSSLLRDYVHPQLLLFGHNHCTKVCPVGCETDHLGQPCTAIIAGRPTKDPESDAHIYSGAAISIDADGADVIFNNSNQEIIAEHRIIFD